jgi:hypothetical protein
MVAYFEYRKKFFGIVAQLFEKLCRYTALEEKILQIVAAKNG